eukprot:TRINITY_DN2159_c0_g1_i1.p1 TRINITY_DN2159_c0_g1~~TRINITY_DN2159_c0_g1_i1.p1  ORF type:complete len:581 (+),score=260.50 TRINITY_DN2159_c0_g1_i1:64-1806(+)
MAADGGKTTLFDLYQKGDPQLVEDFLKKDPRAVNDYNEHGMTPLHVAVEDQQLNLVKRLTALGAEVNARITSAGGAQMGYTPMHIAAKHGNVDLLQELFDAGASPKKVGHDSWSVLHSAAFSGRTDAVKWLLNHRVDVNACNEHKVTPLDFLANKGRIDATRMMLKAGAKPNIVDVQGENALHHGMHVQMFKLFGDGYDLPESQIDIMCLLAIYGGDFRQKNNDGFEPLHFVDKCFGGGAQFSRLLTLLSMNSKQIQGSEGTITSFWNYMTILSIKNRKVWENIGIDPQQAADLVAAVHQFEDERLRHRKKGKEPDRRRKRSVVVESDGEDGPAKPEPAPAAEPASVAEPEPAAEPEPEPPQPPAPEEEDDKEFTVLCCADIYGTKANLPVTFPSAPTLQQLRDRMTEMFEHEYSVGRPQGGQRHFNISRMDVYSDDNGRWEELSSAQQLQHHVQVYVFQRGVPDVQSDLPAPRAPSAPAPVAAAEPAAVAPAAAEPPPAGFAPWQPQPLSASQPPAWVSEPPAWVAQPPAWVARPPAAPAAVQKQVPELGWLWLHENRTAVLCCIVSLLLGMHLERWLG